MKYRVLMDFLNVAIRWRSTEMSTNRGTPKSPHTTRIDFSCQSRSALLQKVRLRGTNHSIKPMRKLHI